MKSQCQCPKWYEVISARELCMLLQKYLEHPEYGERFSIHQPCFMCQNDDRIETYSTDEFNPRELFGKLPHPETLNLYFVGVLTLTNENVHTPVSEMTKMNQRATEDASPVSVSFVLPLGRST